MKKILLLLIAMLLIVPTALACKEGERCIPWIFEYAVDPCNTADINLTSPLTVKINASGCPQGKAIPAVSCKQGWESITINFWQVMKGDYLNYIRNINWAGLILCVQSHYQIYCDNVSARVIVYDNNATARYDTGWSTFQMGYMGGVGDTAILFDIDDTEGFNHTGDCELVLMAKTTNITENYYVVRLNYTVTESGPIHYGRCVLSNLEPPEFIIGKNRLTNTFSGFGRWGASFLYTLMIIIVGAVMFLALKSNARDADIRIAGGMTLVVMLLLIIIGAYLRIISWVFLAIFFVFVSAGIVKKAKEIFT